MIRPEKPEELKRRYRYVSREDQKRIVRLFQLLEADGKFDPPASHIFLNETGSGKPEQALIGRYIGFNFQADKHQGQECR